MTPQTQRSGPPPPAEARPQDQALTKPIAGSTVPPNTGIDRSLVTTAIRLVRTLAEQAAAERATDDAAFREGYRLGFTAGWDVGYGHAHHEIAEQQRRAAERLVKACLTNLAREGRAARLFPGQTIGSMEDILTARILDMLGEGA